MADILQTLHNLMQSTVAPAQAQRGPAEFNRVFKCYPVACANKEKLEAGDKILLPPSALDHLARLRVTYPMLFEVKNQTNPRQCTHCGVMEFSSEEGVAYLPYWVMQNLLLESGGLVAIRNVSLPKGTFVKFQPHSVAFTNLSNPRVVLEKALRGYSCLTQGDTVQIMVDNRRHYLDVVEVRPGTSISVIETDVNVEFDPAKDAKAFEEAQAKLRDTPSPAVPMEEEEKKEEPTGKSSYFAKLGAGHKLKGKRSRKDLAAAAAAEVQNKPTEKSSKLGKLVTEDRGRWRYFYRVSGDGSSRRLERREPLSKRFHPFAGHGRSLKPQ